MLLTLDPDPAFHERVARDIATAGLGMAPARASSLAELEHLLGDGLRVRAVVLGPGIPPDDVPGHIERLGQLVPGTIVLLVAQPTTATLRTALRAGVRDVLAPTFTGRELGEALVAAGYGDEVADDEQVPGRTIVVFSAKGGVGTSVLASNMALRLAAHTGAPTVLADMDLTNADQAVLHGLGARFTVQDLADGGVGADAEALEQVLQRVPDTDVRVLAGPVDPAAAESIGEGAVLDVLRRLRQLYGLVVVDTSSAFSDVTLAVLEAADVIVLPVSLDVLSLRSLSVTLQTFERLGIPRARVRVVAMRADAKVALTLDDVARTTGVDIDVAVPSSRAVPRSVNTATPLALDAPRSGVVKAVDVLVALVTDDVEIHGAAEDGGRRFGLRHRRSPSVQPVAVAPAVPVGADVDTPDPGGDEGQRRLAVRRRAVAIAAPGAAPSRDVEGPGDDLAIASPAHADTPDHQPAVAVRGHRRDVRS